MRCLEPFAPARTVSVLALAVLFVSLLSAQDAAAHTRAPSKSLTSYREAVASLNQAAAAYRLGDRAPSSAPPGIVADRFDLLGHHDLGLEDTNGDVWVHGDFAYVGTWAIPCNGRGVKIIDVSDLRAPQLIGTLASRDGTSAEDMLVRHVSTPFFTGDLLAVGIQRCGEDPALDEQQFGPEFWDVTDPHHPVKLSELGVTNGGGGVHELDLFQRGGNVYALLATPFSEFFDPVPGGDFRIVDVTDPESPMQVGEWGAAADGLTPGPFFGQGSFGASFGHSARANADGTKAYVSYWDLGVLTLDITDVTKPALISRTEFEPHADGDAHSVSEYQGKDRLFLLQNDEDFDPRSPARIQFRGGEGIGSESPGGAPLRLKRGHRVKARVVVAANEGCQATDYPLTTAGKIVVVRTPFPFFDPGFDGVTGQPLCTQADQDIAAAAAGAKAVVHDFIAEATSPQFFDVAEVDIPVVYTDHSTAQAMVAAGRVTLKALKPSWGFLRIFDAATGEQVAEFDDVDNVHALPPPPGDWSIHNSEVIADRAYVSWYSNGIIALDLEDLNDDDPDDPEMVGQFVPEGAPSHVPFIASGVPNVWGVAIRLDSVDKGDDGDGDNGDNDRRRRDRNGGDDDDDDDDRADDRAEPIIFLSDLNSGLWIIQPTGDAAP
jgi:hypothetical protein